MVGIIAEGCLKSNHFSCVPHVPVILLIVGYRYLATARRYRGVSGGRRFTMDENNRPRKREKNVTGGGAGVHRRGEGLGTGKVGSGSGNPAGGGRPQGGPSFHQPAQPTQQNGQSYSGTRATRGLGGGKLILIVIVLLILFGGGGKLAGLFGGGGGTVVDNSGYSNNVVPAATPRPTPVAVQQSPVFSGQMQQVTSHIASTSSTGTGSWTVPSNNGTLNTRVAPGARSKFTSIRGGGRDTVTIMVYMCGTDLESRGAMASKDLQEMASATLSSKVNIIVYTGGCKSWQIQGISNSVNQIYKVEQGGLRPLETNAGTGVMTDPNTLLSFLDYCGKNYPADRNMLIFWDHGGGSVSGYGYDEKNARAGSMSLAQIDSALQAAGMQYDFIGFDACLMATTETGLMLSRYADYMIASEETEPGVGWYYTNWLTDLSANTSTPTLDIGKRIVDDFVDVCNRQCQGQKTTLSVVDLAELSGTLGDAFTAFAKDTRDLITGDDFRVVSTARSNTREFAGSNRIDQIDLVDFAQNLGTEKGRALANVLLSAVKYNRYNNVSKAYGLSIYFPLNKVSDVDQAVKTYNSIGLDASYSECIREFAGLAVSGQVAAGGTASPMSSLFGLGSSGASGQSAMDITSLLGAFLGGGMGDISGLSSANTGFFSGRALSNEDAAAYIAANSFDPSSLQWYIHDGVHKVIMPQEQWDLITDLDLNMFYDDGEGYVDLGLDNTFELDSYGNLIGETDGTWLSINGQPVAYYRLSTAEENGHYAITGYVPVLLNGERHDLILAFTDAQPDGYIAGALPAYADGETQTVARGLIELVPGDRLDFLCDYYSYDGEYLDSYMLGEQMTVTENMVISNTYLGDGCVELYRFTDIYAQHYWTLPVPEN